MMDPNNASKRPLVWFSPVLPACHALAALAAMQANARSTASTAGVQQEEGAQGGQAAAGASGKAASAGAEQQEQARPPSPQIEKPIEVHLHMASLLPPQLGPRWLCARSMHVTLTLHPRSCTPITTTGDGIRGVSGRDGGAARQVQRASAGAGPLHDGGGTALQHTHGGALASGGIHPAAAHVQDWPACRCPRA